MRNPYIIDRPLTIQDYHQGREASFHHLADLLNTGERLVLLYGKRYSGKTSFINQLPVHLSARYQTKRCELVAPDEGASLLWSLLAGLARTLDRALPDQAAYEAAPEAYCSRYLRDLISEDEQQVQLICFDALPIASLATQEEWQRVPVILWRALQGITKLAVLLVIEGHPAEIEGENPLSFLPWFMLDPLKEEETEDLLYVPVRNILVYDMEAMRRIHQLAGGHRSLFRFLDTFSLSNVPRPGGWACRR